MFFTRKKSISPEEAAEMLFYFADKYGRGLARDDLKNSSYSELWKDIDSDIFIEECFILFFWLLSLLLSPREEKIMQCLHILYLKEKGLDKKDRAAKEEWEMLNSRYEEYDGFFDPMNAKESINKIAGAVVKNIYNDPGAELNLMKVSLMANRITVLMSAINDSFVKKYEIKI